MRVDEGEDGEEDDSDLEEDAEAAWSAGALELDEQGHLKHAGAGGGQRGAGHKGGDEAAGEGEGLLGAEAVFEAAAEPEGGALGIESGKGGLQVGLASFQAGVESVFHRRAAAGQQQR